MQSAIVRPWQGGDFERLRRVDGLSGTTLAARFHTGTPRISASYLRAIEQRWPLNWDAVVAVVDDELVGWAEYGWTIESIPRADIAICVPDRHQRTGLGRRLALAVAHRAVTAGFTVLHADIQSPNAAAFSLWASVTGSRRPTYEAATPPVLSLGGRRAAQPIAAPIRQ